MSVEKDTVELYEDKGKKSIKDLVRKMKPKGSRGDFFFFLQNKGDYATGRVLLQSLGTS